MRIWLDVYDASGARIGPGPVWRVISATITRALDGGGSWRATVAATDPRAIALIQPGREVVIWGEDTAGKRQLGAGVIANWRLTEDPSGVGLIIDGPDLLDALARKNTLLGRIYNRQTVSAVAAGLIALVPGWAVSVDGSIASDLIDARFDGISVLKAFREIAGRYGFHVRQAADGAKVLEVGPFGDVIPERVFKVETVGVEALANPRLLMVERIVQDKTRDTAGFYNVIVPIGAGEGTAALTLAKSDRSTPYPIQSINGPDGGVIYYLATTTYPAGPLANFTQDPAAAVKVGQFKEIAPLSNSEADIRNAANALYDAAAAALARASMTQERYALTIKNARGTIRAGDRVHINYRARVRTEAGVLDYLDVRGDYWVMSASERISPDGATVDLEVSNIDRIEQDEGELLFDRLEAIDLRNLKPNITVGTPSTYVYDREIAPSFPARVPIEITNTTLELLRVRFRLKTGPFRSVASSTFDTSPAHVHFFGTADTGIPPGIGSTGYVVLRTIGGGSIYLAGTLYGASPVVLATDPTSNTHSHALAFGITDDTATPTGVTVWFQGVNVTAALFGAGTLAPSGGALNVLADAGALANLLANATGGLRQLHELEIRCAGGRGRVEATIERYETTQAIRL